MLKIKRGFVDNIEIIALAHAMRWFKARTEFECAEQIRQADVFDIQSPQQR